MRAGKTMKDNISPEEKLLKLIKGQKKPVSSPFIANPSAAQDVKLPQIPAKTLKKHFSFLSIPRIISFAFVASILYLIISLISPLWETKRIEAELKEIPKAQPILSAARKPQETKPLDFYLSSVKTRAIFGGISESQGAGRPAKAADADLIKNINLVGIISGENPQAIIEDKKAQKTYYLSKGQFIGDLEVDDIQEGKIILNYNGQRYELHL